MKVKQMTSPDPGFHPFTLSVTFETLDEVNKMIEALGPYNIAYNLYEILLEEHPRHDPHA